MKSNLIKKYKVLSTNERIKLLEESILKIKNKKYENYKKELQNQLKKLKEIKQ